MASLCIPVAVTEQAIIRGQGIIIITPVIHAIIIVIITPVVCAMISAVIALESIIRAEILVTGSSLDPPFVSDDKVMREERMSGIISIPVQRAGPRVHPNIIVGDNTVAYGDGAGIIHDSVSAVPDHKTVNYRAAPGITGVDHRSRAAALDHGPEHK
jgi:hypothetical protein